MSSVTVMISKNQLSFNDLFIPKEVGLSNCECGCKIYLMWDGSLCVIHSRIYGCKAGVVGQAPIVLSAF